MRGACLPIFFASHELLLPIGQRDEYLIIVRYSEPSDRKETPHRHLRCMCVPSHVWLFAIPTGCSPPRFLCSGKNFPGKNTGMGCHFLLQHFFPTRGSNSCLLHWQVGSLLGNPISKMPDLKDGRTLSSKDTHSSRKGKKCFPEWLSN